MIEIHSDRKYPEDHTIFLQALRQRNYKYGLVDCIVEYQFSNLTPLYFGGGTSSGKQSSLCQRR